MYQQQVRLWPARRGAEACHMVGVKNKEDLFYVVAALGFLMAGLASDGGVGFIPEGNGDRPWCRLARRQLPGAIVRRCQLVIVGDKQMN